MTYIAIMRQQEYEFSSADARSMLSPPYDSRETVASGLLTNLLLPNFALVSLWEFM
jgi:hypothetical protein